MRGCLSSLGYLLLGCVAVGILILLSLGVTAGIGWALSKLGYPEKTVDSVISWSLGIVGAAIVGGLLALGVVGIIRDIQGKDD